MKGGGRSLQPDFNMLSRVCKHDNSLFLWQKSLWFSLRLFLFYLLGSMAAGQVTEVFVIARSENRWRSKAAKPQGY